MTSKNKYMISDAEFIDALRDFLGLDPISCPKKAIKIQEPSYVRYYSNVHIDLQNLTLNMVEINIYDEKIDIEENYSNNYKKKYHLFSKA